MQIPFYKYQANGNDFIIINNIEGNLMVTNNQIKILCNRHFGIGADGLMLVEKSSATNFEMKYFNADGQLSSMCGNGGRCIAAFAFLNNLADRKMTFIASDGAHEALIGKEEIKEFKYNVSLSMGDVDQVEKADYYYFLNTGSPHYVEFVDKVAEIDVFSLGRKTRYSELFSPEGVNVNFVEISSDRIFVRTYERGVENETLSCGTGVTAAAIAAFLETGRKDLQIHTIGGEFNVYFEHIDGVFKSVNLKGPAEYVFNGTIEV